VPEVQSAVDAEKWKSTFDRGTREDGELESARLNGLLRKWRRLFLLSAEGEKSLSCGAWMVCQCRLPRIVAKRKSLVVMS
jgi:hypothetical protein